MLQNSRGGFLRHNTNKRARIFVLLQAIELQSVPFHENVLGNPEQSGGLSRLPELPADKCMSFKCAYQET